MKLFSALSLACLLSIVVSYATAYNIDDYNNVIQSIYNKPEYQKDFNDNLEKILSYEPDYFDYTPFKRTARKLSPLNCPIDDTDYVKATSVHRLRPRDIQVVAAMGDSLTAAFGANARTILGLLLEYRGRSWSHGGDSDVQQLVTLPNLIKVFNPDLVGYSTGLDISLLTKQGKGLNVAVSGDVSGDMLGQAEILINRLKENEEIDYQNDWKLITLFIGANDLAAICKDREAHTPSVYINNIQNALDLLYKEVPRAFVNLVGVIDVTEVKYLNQGLICTLIHKLFASCVAYPSSDEVEQELEQFFQEYQNLTQALADSGRYDGRDDFTVVSQPLFRNFKAPRLPSGDIDLSFFAPDCFHLSAKGHAAAAVGLWNNLLQPVGNKSTSWSSDDPILCPSGNRKYFFTNKNSKDLNLL